MAAPTEGETDVAEPTEVRPSRRSHGPRRSDETHGAILDAAEALLTEKGPNGVTFEAVARRAGAGKPTLYRWWASRAALLFEVYERLKSTVMPSPDTGSLAGDLTAVLGDLWRFWRDGPAGAAYAAILSDARTDPATRAIIVAQITAPDFSLRPFFARAVARGEVDEAEATALCEFVVAMNWLRLQTDRLDPADIPGLIDALVGRRGPRTA
jgi:AcrR family transcriptional regulator